MGLDFFHSKAVDKSMVLLRLRTGRLRNDLPLSSGPTVDVSIPFLRCWQTNLSRSDLLLGKSRGILLRRIAWLLRKHLPVLRGLKPLGRALLRPSRRQLVLFQSGLMPLFQRLHLFLLLVTAMNCLPHGPTDRAANVFTSMVVTQYISTRDAVRDETLLVLALSYVLPQSLHPGTVWGDRALPVLVRTFCCMS